MNKLIKTNHEGSFDVELSSRTRVTLRTTEPFSVSIQRTDQTLPEILGPDRADQRYFQAEFGRDTILSIQTTGIVTMIQVALPEREEYPDPTPHCDMVEDEQLSMYDRLKAEMFQALSVYAEEKGLDTWDEDDDLEFIEDDNLINTPYEYEALKDEFVQSLSAEAEAPAPSEVGAADTTQNTDTESPTTTEQPADTSAV